jgi:predicted DNA-binding transcriptional regulator AlpA
MSTASADDEDTTTLVFAAGRGDRRAPTSRSTLWNPADVAAFLQVSRSWVYQKAEAGLLPVIRLPGSSLLRFDPDTVRAFARGDWKPAATRPVHADKRPK